MISVICCFNDKKIYNEICKKAVENQKGISFEIIEIDNTKGKYKSAAEALNYAMSIVKNEYAVCVHQDFGFMDSNALKTIYDCLDGHSEYYIVGGAGAVYDAGSSLLSKIIGRNRSVISYLKPPNKWDTNQIYEVESIDECFFAINKKLWNEHKFDEKICFAWDLYSVEMCLYVRKKGGRCQVLPLEGIHLSYGNITTNYYKSLHMLAKQYRRDFKYIVTTCAVLRTGCSDFFQIKWLVLVNYLRIIRTCLNN